MSKPKSDWNETCERVTRTLERGVHRGGLAKPRHGASFKGRLAQLLREFRVLLHRCGSVAATCERAVSGKTRRERRVVMKRMLIDLFEGGFELRHLNNFKGKHAFAILSRWTEIGLASSTMATYVSHLRVFVGWLDKAELVGVIDKYCADRPGLIRRKSATDTDKSERGAGVDFAEIYRRAVATGIPHFACQLLLMQAFGLRAREAARFRPHQAITATGHVIVNEGTKGGRPRQLIMPPNELQLFALEQARALVTNPAGSMIPPRYVRAEQWSRRFYRLCEKIGLTKKKLGVTPHSLRHGAFLTLYEELTGVPAPVRRTVDVVLDPVVDRNAREVVAQDLGHSRLEVSSAYLGSSRRRIARRAALANTPPEGPPDSGESNRDGSSSDNGP